MQKIIKLKDFDYSLPKNLIAQKPSCPRDHSRLLSVKLEKNNSKYSVNHKHFYDIIDFLQKGDVLILNNSKVFPARLIGKKEKTGGKIEVFLLHKLKSSSKKWQCLIGGKGVKEDLEINFENKLKCKIIKNNNKTWDVEFNKSGSELIKIINKIGKTPLPPYIKSYSGHHNNKSWHFQHNQPLKTLRHILPHPLQR